MSAVLVSIMGPVGVGKTTLARHLAAELPARLIEEDYQGNPFLEEAYAGVPDARSPAQAYFLLSRVKQLDRRGLDGLAVSDYAFRQDAIFAACNLAGQDLRAYRRLARVAGKYVQPPSVMIHLDAAEPTLLERMAARGRSFERNITAEFLSRLRQAYRRAAAQVRRPVLAVDCEQVNLIDPLRRAELLARLHKALGQMQMRGHVVRRPAAVRP